MIKKRTRNLVLATNHKNTDIYEVWEEGRSLEHQLETRK